MASSVNRAHRGRGRIRHLPRRYNRTAVDRFASGCGGLSGRGVSVELHQTLIQGSAALPRGARRLRGRGLAPEKLIRLPTPALQNAGLGPEGRPSSVLARREGSHTAGAQCNPPGVFNDRDACRGLIQATGVPGIGASAGAGLVVPDGSPCERRSPAAGPSSAARSPARPGVPGGRGRPPRRRGGRPRPRLHEAKKRCTSKACCLRSRW
jgi:hypothetical protein